MRGRNLSTNCSDSITVDRENSAAKWAVANAASSVACEWSNGYLPGSDSRATGSPPWVQTRTVCQGEPTRLFSQLKSRLSLIVPVSRHARQRLYKDQQTGQHWLSLIVAIRRFDERLEILKPVSSDVAESLSGGSDQLMDYCLPE